jgi:hypothetical protein
MPIARAREMEKQMNNLAQLWVARGMEPDMATLKKYNYLTYHSDFVLQSIIRSSCPGSAHNTPRPLTAHLRRTRLCKR